MTYAEYLSKIKDALEFDSAENFTACIDYPADAPYTPENWPKVCSIIYDAAHGDIKALQKERSARAFALKYGLPARTVQQWIAGTSDPPEYVTALIGFAMISEIPTVTVQK